MGLMDKVKAQASQVAAKAQEGVKAGQTKMEEAQAKKRQDALLRDLGAQLYAERLGRGDTTTAAEVERIVAELRALEAEHGDIATKPTADDSAPTGGSATPTTGGEFTLDEL